MEKILLIIAVVVFLIVVYPLAVIWSLNTLFALSIAYTVKAWAAVVVLTAIFAAPAAAANS